MNQKQFQDLLKRYREGNCTPEEEKIIDDWFASISTGKSAFSDAAEEATSKETTWASVDTYIEESLSGHKKSGKVIRFHTFAAIGIAASIVLAGIIFMYVQTNVYTDKVFVSDDRTTVSGGLKLLANRSDEQLEISLPDNSTITLMPHSQVRYAPSFSGVRREVFLEGEAFFHVARDTNRPFLVYTNGLTTEVLGTSFLVSAYKGEKEIVVTVKTGKVSVYTNEPNEVRADDTHSEIILTPNQQAIYHTGEKITLKKLVPEPEVILPLPTLRDSYTNTSVVDILRSLEENYGIDIEYDSVVLSNCTLTSDMSEEGFYEQIKILCNALGAEYKISENAVIITATGCQAY